MKYIKIIATMVVIFTATAPIKAQSSIKSIPKGNVAAGEILFATGIPAKNIPACVSCHGGGNIKPLAGSPTLDGQLAEYLVKQLLDFQDSAKRNNPIMSEYAKTLSLQDIYDLSAYLSNQTPMPNSATNKDKIILGEKIYRAGLANKAVPACAACHGPAGSGLPIRYPRLAGQMSDYTVVQLKDFRSKNRTKASPMMTDIALRLSDIEMEAVADYIAGLRNNN